MVIKEKCSNCGYDKHKGSLHIHHMDGNHNNNEPANIIVLCANCHMELHQTETPKRSKRDEYKERMDIVRDLKKQLNDIEIDKNMFQRAHNDDLKRIMYLQGALRSILPFREYSKIIKACSVGW